MGLKFCQRHPWTTCRLFRGFLLFLKTARPNVPFSTGGVTEYWRLDPGCWIIVSCFMFVFFTFSPVKCCFAAVAPPLFHRVHPVKPCVAGATKLLFHRVNFYLSSYEKPLSNRCIRWWQLGNSHR